MFYVDQVGFSVEQDIQVDERHRFVELMPPGSPCSIALATGNVDSAPSSLKGVQLNIEDADEVYSFLRDRGVDVSEIEDCPWGRFCFLSDPDGNGWSIRGPLRSHEAPRLLRLAGFSRDPASNLVVAAALNARMPL